MSSTPINTFTLNTSTPDLASILLNLKSDSTTSTLKLSEKLFPDDDNNSSLKSSNNLPPSSLLNDTSLTSIYSKLLTSTNLNNLLNMSAVSATNLNDLASLNNQNNNNNNNSQNNSNGEKIDQDNSDACNCRKSRCLKLYCQCFAAKIICSSTCRCLQCDNKSYSNPARDLAIKSILDRNPNAFESKYKQTSAPPTSIPLTSQLSTALHSSTNNISNNSDINFLDPLEGAYQISSHKNGCRCRKSLCLKKYCECFQGGVQCSNICTCINCYNKGPGINSLSTSSSTVPTNNVAPNASVVSVASVDANKISQNIIPINNSTTTTPVSNSSMFNSLAPTSLTHTVSDPTGLISSTDNNSVNNNNKRSMSNSMTSSSPSYLEQLINFLPPNKRAKFSEGLKDENLTVSPLAAAMAAFANQQLSNSVNSVKDDNNAPMINQDTIVALLAVAAATTAASAAVADANNNNNNNLLSSPPSTNGLDLLTKIFTNLDPHLMLTPIPTPGNNRVSLFPSSSSSNNTSNSTTSNSSENLINSTESPVSKLSNRNNMNQLFSPEISKNYSNDLTLNDQSNLSLNESNIFSPIPKVSPSSSTSPPNSSSNSNSLGIDHLNHSNLTDNDEDSFEISNSNLNQKKEFHVNKELTHTISLDKINTEEI